MCKKRHRLLHFAWRHSFGFLEIANARDSRTALFWRKTFNLLDWVHDRVDY